MTSLQKLVLVTGIILLIAFLFPPFQIIHPMGGAQNAGYSFIFSPPVKGAKIDALVLLTEWVGIILISAACALYIFLSRLKKEL